MGQTDSTHGVMPELAELVALRQRVLGWPPPRQSRTPQAGAGLSPLRGRGMEYAESRLYAAGDDARHIDWRVTARTGRTHTKLYHAERDRLSVVIADTAPSLYFGTRVCFKSVLAARIGAVLAWAAVRGGDRLLALRGSRSEAPLPPAGGARGALRVLDALVRWYRAVPGEDTGVAEALHTAERLVPPGTRWLLLLDPRSVSGVEPARWQALAARHDTLAVLLVDPFELQPPRGERLFAVGEQRIALDLGHPQLRQAWQVQFGDALDAAEALLRRCGWQVHRQATDQPPEAVLSRLLHGIAEVA